jgi:hypothetical protein
MPWNMLAKMLGKQSGIKIVPATRAEPDDDVDRISGIEVLVVCHRRRRHQSRGSGDNKTQQPVHSAHQRFH